MKTTRQKKKTIILGSGRKGKATIRIGNILGEIVNFYVDIINESNERMLEFPFSINQIIACVALFMYIFSGFNNSNSLHFTTILVMLSSISIASK